MECKPPCECNCPPGSGGGGGGGGGGGVCSGPLRQVCFPRPVKCGQFRGTPIVIGDCLGGGLIYQNCDGSKFKGTPNYCRCLHPSSLIQTPSGWSRIVDVAVGDIVMYYDEFLGSFPTPVIKTGWTGAYPGHRIVRVRFSGGTEWMVSPGHPLWEYDGTVGDLKPGENVIGIPVVSVESIPYDESATYDILTESGSYMVSGIPMGSTLMESMANV